MNQPDHYRPPRAALAEADPRGIQTRPLGVLIMAVIQAAVSLAAAWIGPDHLDSIRAAFEEVGVPVPATSSFLYTYRYACWLFPIAGIAIAIWIWRRDQLEYRELHRMRIANRVFLALFAVAVGVVMGATYMAFLEFGRYGYMD